jgi:hypothetical protein
LDYRNLLAACCGNEGSSPSQQHCDVLKKEDDILFNPAYATHDVEAKISYLGDGSIRSDNPNFNLQLNQILNLNLKILKDNREGVLKGVQKVLELRGCQATAGQLKKDIERWTTVNSDGQLKEHCQVVKWTLRARQKST